jgi:hypothetical protein
MPSAHGFSVMRPTARLPERIAIYDEADQRPLIKSTVDGTPEKGKDGRIAWLINMSKDTFMTFRDPADLNFDPARDTAHEQRKKVSVSISLI